MAAGVPPGPRLADALLPQAGGGSAAPPFPGCSDCLLHCNKFSCAIQRRTSWMQLMTSAPHTPASLRTTRAPRQVRRTPPQRLLDGPAWALPSEPGGACRMHGFFRACPGARQLLANLAPPSPHPPLQARRRGRRCARHCSTTATACCTICTLTWRQPRRRRRVPSSDAGRPGRQRRPASTQRLGARHAGPAPRALDSIGGSACRGLWLVRSMPHVSALHKCFKPSQQHSRIATSARSQLITSPRLASPCDPPPLCQQSIPSPLVAPCTLCQLSL